jgi:hypothetical protein
VHAEELVRNYPRLFHMAAAGAWPSIAAYGLLPMRDIVATSALTGARHILEAVLVDMTVPECLATLNDRVYFWLHPKRLAALLRSRPNRSSEHDIMTVDTASLVAAHHHQIRLSAINSGATQWPSAPQRGPDTFRTIEQYPFTERRRNRPLDQAIAELAVIGGVPDIAAHVVDVQRERAA